MCSKPVTWKGGPLLWILPLYLYVNKKFDDDDDDGSYYCHPDVGIRMGIRVGVDITL